MKVRFALSALLALSTLVAVGCDDEDEDPNGPPDTNTFEADLTGGAERPNPVVTSATGDATFTVSTSGTTTTISYIVTVSGNLSGPVTAAHIHGPAGVNEAVGVIVPLTVSSTALTGTVVQGSFTTTGNATINIAQLLVHMLAGNTYVNLHTAANPGGEIRGQISD
jgi:CHRD domain-containing protein